MKIFDIEIKKLYKKDLLNDILSFEKRSIVFTPNPEILLESLEDNKFKENLEKADYLTADWIGLYLAFQILDDKSSKIIKFIKLPYYLYRLFFKRKSLYDKYGERICWSDLSLDILNFSNENDKKITIIDLYNPNDKNKIASQSVFKERLKQKYKNLNLDYIIYNPSKKEDIIKQIQNNSSEILFSTLGMKKQEESIVEIMSKCENIKLWLWVGSSFDYIVWFQKRAPLFFRKVWIEWLYRLITWPQKIKRLNRLYRAIFLFTYKVINMV